MLAGGAIHCRSRLHPTVALSSTESELFFMVDAGKAALCLQSILEEIGLEQTDPTPIQSDNRGARMLSNAQRPTKRTRHVDTQNMVVMQWTEDEKVSYTDTKSEHNWSDSLSKVNGRIKHHEHMDCMMGRRQPACSRKRMRDHDATTVFSTCKIYKIMTINEFCDSASAGA